MLISARSMLLKAYVALISLVFVVVVLLSFVFWVCSTLVQKAQIDQSIYSSINIECNTPQLSELSFVFFS